MACHGSKWETDMLNERERERETHTHTEREREMQRDMMIMMTTMLSDTTHDYGYMWDVENIDL